MWKPFKLIIDYYNFSDFMILHLNNIIYKMVATKLNIFAFWFKMHIARFFHFNVQFVYKQIRLYQSYHFVCFLGFSITVYIRYKYNGVISKKYKFTHFWAENKIINVY